jgi:hypothetical protein
MNRYLYAIVQGAKAGACEAPRLYFAPLIVLLAWMSRVSKKGARLQRLSRHPFDV